MVTARRFEIVLIRRLHRLRSAPVSRAIAIVAILTVVALAVAACGASPRRVLRVDALARQGLVVGDQVRIVGVAAGRVSGLSRHVLASGAPAGELNWGSTYQLDGCRTTPLESCAHRRRVARRTPNSDPVEHCMWFPTVARCRCGRRRLLAFADADVVSRVLRTRLGHLVRASASSLQGRRLAAA